MAVRLPEGEGPRQAGPRAPASPGPFLPLASRPRRAKAKDSSVSPAKIQLRLHCDIRVMTSSPDMQTLISSIAASPDDEPQLPDWLASRYIYM